LNGGRLGPGPFPGLRPFEAKDQFLFFGRDAQTDELLTRLGRMHFVAVVGTSASGKSSLVRAGVLPALNGGFMAEAGSKWRVATMRPESGPLASLAQALENAGALGDESDASINSRSSFGSNATPPIAARPTKRRPSSSCSSRRPASPARKFTS
jgi:energy-coupling factor transporter ATP-binding protein EcfA2